MLGGNGSLRAMNPDGYLGVFPGSFPRPVDVGASQPRGSRAELPGLDRGRAHHARRHHVGLGRRHRADRSFADDLPSSPDDPGSTEVLEWAAEQSRQLADALKGADPDSDCWTFGLPRSRLFWFRRQALETAVHAWDVQHATGRPDPIDPDLATDGIDQFLAVMLPRDIQRHPDSWTGQSLHLHRTDGDGEWTIRLGPGASLSADRTHGEGDVTLRGPASSLYLWCLNRLPSTDLDLVGDGAIADRWTTEVSF